MNTRTSALTKARAATVGAVLAAALVSGAVGVHLADASTARVSTDRSGSSSSASNTGRSSGSSSSFGTTSGVSSSNSAAQTTTNGS